MSKCWKEGCHLGQHYRDVWGDLAGEGLALSSLLLLRSPGLAGRIKPGLQSGGVLAGCASGQNELKWGTLPPPWTHQTHREIQGSLHWVSCLFSSESVPCIFNLPVAHSAHLPVKGWSVQACLRQPKAPSWCQWWRELESSSSTFGTRENSLRGSETRPVSSLRFSPPSLCNEGLGIGPRFSRTAFLFSCRGHSRRCEVLPALLQRSQGTNNSCLPPPLGRSMGTQRVGFALGTGGLPWPLSWQLVQTYSSE